MEQKSSKHAYFFNKLKKKNSEKMVSNYLQKVIYRVVENVRERLDKKKILSTLMYLSRN